MNKLVIIGNGFDLAHGLKTSYNDFILHYINEKVLKGLKSNLRYIDKLVNASIKARMHPDEKINDLSELKELISRHHGSINANFIFFDNLVDIHANLNWVDIEAFYYEELKKLYNRLDKLGVSKNENITTELKELNTCFDLIKGELAEYLKQIEVPNRNIDIQNHFVELIRSIDNQDIRNNNALSRPNNQMMVLNFNYTDTGKLYLNNISNKQFISFNFIHGELNNSKNPTIFGYGDEIDSYYEKIELLNDNEFLKNFKSFYYFKTDNYRNLQKFMNISNPSGNKVGFEVHIMGHSCGLSDRILLNSIFEHIACKSIRIYYYQKTESENDFFEKTQDISRHFKPSGKGDMRIKIISLEESSPLTRYIPK